MGDAYNPLDGAAVVADLTGDGVAELVVGSSEVTGSCTRAIRSNRRSPA